MSKLQSLFGPKLLLLGLCFCACASGATTDTDSNSTSTATDTGSNTTTSSNTECQPLTCEDVEVTCGVADDGCGGEITCMDDSCDPPPDDCGSGKGTLQWVKATAGTGSAAAEEVVVNKEGETIAVGYMSGSVTFGLGEATETTLVASSMIGGLFVARYAADGALQWATGADASGEILPRSVAYAANGTIWVVGRFMGTAVLGPGEKKETTLVSTPHELSQQPSLDVFVAKFAPSGELEWAKSDGGPINVDASSVAVAADGSLRVAGMLESGAVFGDGELTETTIMLPTSPPQSAIWLARYDADGSFGWIRHAGGNAPGFNGGEGVAQAPDGHFLLTGYIASSATFGQGEPTETTLSSAGGNDAFLAWYDAAGNFVRARHAGSSSVDEGQSVVATSDSGALLTGRFSGSATFGAGDPNQTVLAASGSLNAQEAFVARYDAQGALVWATSAGGDYFDTGTDISVSPDGDVVVVGHFSGNNSTAEFGAGQMCATTVSTHSSDAFVAKYQADGALRWVRSTKGQAGSAFTDARGLGVATDGSIRAVGSLSGTVVFGEGEPGETTVKTGGFTPAAFIASYAP